ncbi:exosome non-catalytic core subunit rrp46, variant 2 [Ascochyta rabiei]|uniref:exosome non-catalytic core subunit rrp46, variant 2 n=1 Tax=Didymella rabiei TaxID=5454 RepID=UPI0021FD73B4|nr:exosome non-catalytic core subunit rrp46, variant 2 [Ascochyta rabiei]UPX14741.1 exosome non-catalytic core subunit rrp46, variant 2 [Ascochyta rabiei]
MVAPEVTLTHLNRADGSATYTHHGYSIIGAVNGPIEVQRRDEQPEEATLEVNVRPSAGVGTPRERHLETLLHTTLRSIILTRLIPRTLVQVTLQVRSLPEEDTSTGVNTSLTLLPHLLHTALLGLLSASIPLATTLTSVLVAYPSASTKSSTPLLAPTANELLRAKPVRSIHVFAFSGDRRLLLDESDGRFGYDEWEEASELAEEACCREEDEGGVSLRDSMEVDGGVQSKNLHQWLRGIVATKVAYEQRWKSAT